MKCFHVQYNKNTRYEGYIFAETRGKAQYETLKSLKDVGFRNAKFIDIRIKRESWLDKYFIEEHKIFDLDNVLTYGR